MSSQNTSETIMSTSSQPGQARRTSSGHSSQMKQRQQDEGRGSRTRRPHTDDVAPLSDEITRTSTGRSKKRQPKWWKVRLFRGVIGDVKRRAPYYWSDWKDAWDYRVVPATTYMYFAKYESNIPFTTHCLLTRPLASSQPSLSRSTCSPKPTTPTASTRSS